MEGEFIDEKYRVLHRLASGGMGDVYLAKHELLGRHFAIKFMKPDLVADKETLKRFFSEAQIAASTKSDHVVDVSDLGFHNDLPYIVMEWLEGMTLETILESFKTPGPIETANLMAQVCRALERIHNMGVVHRDLKPSNLMLVERDDRQVVKILDFGISLFKTGKEYVRLTSTGAIMGTPAYMAPEQARGEKHIDYRVDIYAMGAILYEMLTLRAPFSGDNYNRLIIQVVTTEPHDIQKIKPHLDDALCNIVRKAMEKDASRRYQSAGEMADALRAYAKGEESLEVEPIEEPSEIEILDSTEPAVPGTPASGTIKPIAFKGTTSRASPAQRRHMALIIAVSAIVLVLGATLVGIFVLADRGKKTSIAVQPAGKSARPETSQSAAQPAVKKVKLSIYTEPREAWIEVNGRPWGKSPISTKVEAGKITIRVSKAGYKILREEFEIGKDSTKRFVLEPEVPEIEVPVADTKKTDKKKADKKKAEKKKSDKKQDKEEKPVKTTYGQEVD
jgi:serine/threonine protein kinase